MDFNHVNMDKLKELMAATKENPANAKIIPKVTGDWIFEEGQPQFQADIEVESGNFKVEADMPSKLGGWGSRPGPLHWCLYGLASCYAFTFAALAAMEGIALSKLSVEAEGHIDFSKVLGLSENPIVEGINFTVTVSSNASPEQIERVQRLAEDRCPALYCLTQSIKVTTQLR
jgi:uncharacterized OsmC-like protein